MKITKIGSTTAVIAGALCLVVAQCGGHAFAASTSASKSVTNSANSLKVSPLRTDLTIKPGDSGTATVYVTNLTRGSLQLQPVENDFVAGDEKGTPSIILDPNSYAPSHSLKRFMVSLQDVTVASEQTATVTLKVHVPATAQAGGYFGALRFTPVGASGDKSVNLTPSVASLVLLTVPGPTVEQMTLTDFDVQQNGGSASNFRTPNDLSLLLRFQNKGNLQEAPFGQVYVQKGKKILYSHSFNQDNPKDEVLPDSARRWTVPLKGLGKFGKYTVTGTFTYGTKGQSIEISKTIWIIPTAVILMVVGGIVLLALIIGGLYLFMKSYKRKILRSSRRRY